MRLTAFVDFDGTIARNDVGNDLFRRFGGERCDALVRAYREERLSAVECFRAEAEAVGTVAQADFWKCVDDQPIDPEFPRFVRFCREHQIALTVVSDGLDLYIRRILAAHGLHDLPVVANHARLAQAGDGVRMVLEFPHTNAECARCASCKRNAMLTATGEDELIVYVGEGYSDRCPARYADLVFARDALQTYCQQENISYILYRTFGEVIDGLESLMQRKRLHKRTAAEHLRREAFTAE
jgi:2-hydroxy-3-keto-5-methylthiopentenyl-1-phosphate phosphatase